jgi:hypothetical protein
MRLRWPGNLYWWRVAAILIAVAGLIDPAFPATRRARPELAIVTAQPGDTMLAARVAQELRRNFTIVRAPFTGAAATVIVGDRLPADNRDLAAPVFAVLSENSGAHVSLSDVRAPTRAPLDARVPVEVNATVRAAKGSTLQVTLQAGGIAVDRVSRDITSDTALIRVPLSFVPTTTGALPLRITAQVGASAEPAVAELDVDVHETPWEILFFDLRPSWMSTFVRRAVERDARFSVASRVVTSRSISSDAGGPPATLTDASALKRYSVIVVGAPEALSARDVAGLDMFLRRRGGAVVLLFDQPARGPLDQLTRVAQWSRTTNRAAARITSNTEDADSLRAADMIWPTQLPARAEAVAHDSANRPVLWHSAVGAGQLIVSGALDAWRYRDASLSSFPDFWQTLIAEAAEAAPPAIDIRLAAARLEPGEKTDVTVWLRDAALRSVNGEPVRATVRAILEKPDGREVVRLLPDGPIGRLRGSLRAPATPGPYRIVVTADAERAALPITVASHVAQPTPHEPDLIRAWTAARRGTAIHAAQLGQLPAALDRAIRPPARKQMTYPMRSSLWILPFAFALAVEWWTRRRRGHA